MFPIRNDLAAYRGGTFDFTLSFRNESDTPWDLSRYQDIKIHFFTLNNQDTPEVVLDQLTISAGDVSGTLSSDETKYFNNRRAFYEVVCIQPGSRMYKANGVFSVWNVNRSEHETFSSVATIQADQPE